MFLPTIEKIAERIYPPEWHLDENSTSVERKRVRNHFQTIPEIVADIEITTRKEDLDKLYYRLSLVAGELINNEDEKFLTSQAAMTLAAIALSKSGGKYGADVFATFAAYTDAELKEQTDYMQRQIRAKKNIEALRNEWLRMQGEYVEIVFKGVARLAPDTEAARKLRPAVLARLGKLAGDDFDAYHTVLMSVADLCFNATQFPGAWKMIENSYDDILMLKRQDIDIKPRGKAAQAAMRQLINWHGSMIVKFYDIPTLGQRAMDGFAEDWDRFMGRDRNTALSAIDQVRAVYNVIGCQQSNENSPQAVRLKEGAYRVVRHIDEVKARPVAIRPDGAFTMAARTRVRVLSGS